jgi:DNA-directed RNA polymerase specialized sigma24 family protein
MQAYPPRHAENLKAWLLTIAHRKAIDHHRARGRAPIPFEEPPEPPGAAGHDGDLDLPGAAWERARDLPESQRAVLALRFAADLPHEEIAAILETSPEAVRRRQATAIATLRRALAKEPA